MARGDSNAPKPTSESLAEIAWLATLGPEAQGDVDVTLLRDNLALSPLERLQAASLAAGQVEALRKAMKVAGHA